MPKKIDLAGRKFGRFTVIKDTGERACGAVVWECLCECGNKAKVSSHHLMENKTKSCGCLKIEGLKERHPRINDMNLKKYNLEGTDVRKLTEKIRSDNSSGTKGVYWYKNSQKWGATIGFKNKNINLGYFENKEDAIKARKQAEEKYFKPILEEFQTLREGTSYGKVTNPRRVYGKNKQEKFTEEKERM